MRVTVFGTYDAKAHPRVGVIADGLRAHGHEVQECNAPLGLDTAARVAILAQPWRVPVLLGTLARRWLTLARIARRQPRPDLVLVGYLGHFDVRLARRLFRRSPIVLDHLIGAGDTARDRRLSGGFRQILMRAIDSGALRAADLIVVDTEEHRDALPAADRDRAVVIAVGAPDAWFEAARAADHPGGGGASSEGAGSGSRGEERALRVLFFGLYTPLQGTPVIGRALARLAGEAVEATMIGTGQDRRETQQAAAANASVRWLDWVASDELPALAARHDVCLGIFGTNPKALRVVPNKVFQGAAAGCAIVTSDTPPQRRSLGTAAVFVPPGDPDALARTLLDLAENRAELGRARAAARRLALSSFTAAEIVRPLINRVGDLAGAAPSPADTDATPAGTRRST